MCSTVFRARPSPTRTSAPSRVEPRCTCRAKFKFRCVTSSDEIEFASKGGNATKEHKRHKRLMKTFLQFTIVLAFCCTLLVAPERSSAQATTARTGEVRALWVVRTTL